MSSAEFWERVMTAVADLDRVSYYDILAVPRDAAGDAIRDAYYSLVRIAHPDRHAREPDERRRAVVRYYARIGEAWRVLSTPAGRKAYDEALAGGASRLTDAPRRTIPEKDPKHKTARDLYERALAMAKAGDTRNARTQLEMALGFEPTSVAIQEALASVTPKPIAPAPVIVAAAPLTDVTGSPSALQSQTAAAPEATPAPASPAPAIRLRCSSRAQLADFVRKKLRAGQMTLPGTHPLAPGAPIRIVLALPDAITIELDAVAIEASPTGARIRFAPLSPERRAALAALLDDPSILPGAP